MNTNEKNALLDFMNEQRFLPITEETLQVYDRYSQVIDQHNPAELSYLLFYKGEYFFRIGDFNEALHLLTRCLQAPKKSDQKWLDAHSYNIIGLIYGYLKQENIALSNLLHSLALSEELSLTQGISISNLNIGHIYHELGDYATAMRYYDSALDYASNIADKYYHSRILCQTHRGILFCKMGKSKEALEVFDYIKPLLAESEPLFYDVSVLNFYIRLHDFLQDDVFLHKNLEQLLHGVSSNQDFLEFSEFYFDVCAYFLERKMEKELHTLLEYISRYVEPFPLVFLQHDYLKYQTSYAKAFLTDSEYLAACSQYIELHTRYLKEQQAAKLYSLEYVERIRQAKQDSALFREKSQLDLMTGLLNKYTIQFLVEEDLADALPEKQSALILIDLDHFKQINDTLGHLAGDSLICQTASVIQSHFKDKALCGRIGGDEFLVYISNVTDISLIVLQTEVLRQEISRCISERNITISTQASIGIAFSSEDYFDYESLFAAADTALYRAKLEGRSRVVVAE